MNILVRFFIASFCFFMPVAAWADATFYVPAVPSLVALTSLGAASKLYPTVYVKNIGTYQWLDTACTGTIDGYYFVSASGVAIGCWIKDHFNTVDLDLPTVARPIRLESVTGVNGRRLSIEAVDPNGSAEIQVIPGASITPGSLASQIIFYNKVGSDYERLGITAASNSYVFDSTSHNDGLIRNVYFQNGGVIYDDGRTDIPSFNAAEFSADDSVYLNGATFTTSYNSGTQTWGAGRTTIADWTDTGSSALIVDTRTTTPTSHTSDTTWIDYRRGGVSKWSVGLNTGGENSDSFDVLASGGTVTARFLPATSVFSNDASTDLIARFQTANASGPLIRLDSSGGTPVVDLGACAAVTGGSATDVCLGSRGSTGVVLAPGGVNRLKVVAAGTTMTGVITMSGYGAGTATFDSSGNISSSSDERLKVISGLAFSPSLDDLKRVRPIIYRWNKKSGMETIGQYAGFSAQNVRQAFGPQYADLVTGRAPNGYYSLQERALLAGSYVFLQKLNSREDNLERRLRVLEGQVSKLSHSVH